LIKKSCCNEYITLQSSFLGQSVILKAFFDRFFSPEVTRILRGKRGVSDFD